MIDVSERLLDFLRDQIGVTVLAGSRIYAERVVPPTDYQPSDGPCLCFKRRGGPIDYTGEVLAPSFQFKCYGATEYDANGLYRALYDALNYPQDARVKAAEIEAQGEVLEEPDTDWIFVLCFYSVMIFNE